MTHKFNENVVSTVCTIFGGVLSVIVSNPQAIVDAAIVGLVGGVFGYIGSTLVRFIHGLLKRSLKK